MTNHETMSYKTSMGQVLLQHDLDVFLKEKYEPVLQAIRDHIEHDHDVLPGAIGYTQLVTDHLAAVVRTSQNQSADDSKLSEMLHLPPYT